MTLKYAVAVRSPRCSCYPAVCTLLDPVGKLAHVHTLSKDAARPQITKGLFTNVDINGQ